MKYGKLRIGWSVFWGVGAALLVVMWVRSYWRADQFSVTTKIRITRVDSNYGKLLFATEAPLMAGTFIEKWGVWSGDAMRDVILPPMPEYSVQGFTAATSGTEGPGFAVGAPMWFAVFASASCAVIPWTGWLRWRFSLRALLVGMTLVAVGLGLIVWASG